MALQRPPPSPPSPPPLLSPFASDCSRVLTLDPSPLDTPTTPAPPAFCPAVVDGDCIERPAWYGGPVPPGAPGNPDPSLPDVFDGGASLLFADKDDGGPIALFEDEPQPFALPMANAPMDITGGPCFRMSALTTALRRAGADHDVAPGADAPPSFSDAWNGRFESAAGSHSGARPIATQGRADRPRHESIPGSFRSLHSLHSLHGGTGFGVMDVESWTRDE